MPFNLVANKRDNRKEIELNDDDRDLAYDYAATLGFVLFVVVFVSIARWFLK
jgi:hypothetical protein